MSDLDGKVVTNLANDSAQWKYTKCSGQAEFLTGIQNVNLRD